MNGVLSKAVKLPVAERVALGIRTVCCRCSREITEGDFWTQRTRAGRIYYHDRCPEGPTKSWEPVRPSSG